jgi:hypothetical protein
MKDPAEITITKEPVWSSNTGRSATGLMQGDIVCYKFKIQVKWKTMSQAETAVLNTGITNKPFFDVKFIDPTDSSGSLVTKTFYAGTPTYPVYSYVDGFPRYTGVAVDLIEQ